MKYDEVRNSAPEIAETLEAEVNRQRDTLAMIASENHVSKAVLEAQGSVLTNKYAEGPPGSRYYGGCEHADTIENKAKEKARELWGAEYVNVQPHSGSQANMGVYLAILEPGDKILSLKLTHGGHLSHGHYNNFANQIYDVEQYTLDENTGYLDYEALEKKAEEFEPDLIISGYSAYPREVNWERIQQVAESVEAYHHADIAHITGLVAAGEHANPVGTADFVTGSTHKTIRAGRGGIIMTSEEYRDEITAAITPGMQGGPLMHNIAGKAVGFNEALKPEFEDYARQTVLNAKAMGQRLSERGFELVTGGTDNHLVLVDLRTSHPDVTGKMAEEALQEVGIVLNANTVPGETRKPFIASGIRVGTPALTTRGFTEEAIQEVADIIYDVVDNHDDEGVKNSAKQKVERLASEYTLYE